MIQPSGIPDEPTGDYDRAIADQNEAICLDPQSTQVYWTRGVTWEKMGHYDRALADFDEAVRIDPNDPHAYSCRSGLRATCPDPKYRDGKRAFEDACRANQLVGGMNAVVFDVLAAACAELGDFDSAVKWEQKALDLLGKDDEKTRKDYNTCLELYRDKKPSRIAPVE